MDRNSPLREIKGVGAKTEELFHKIGVYTVGDILLHYPRTYIQYPQAKHVDEVLDGEQAAVLGRITRTPVVRKVRTMQITVTTISEMGASLELVWYRMPYMKNNLKVGSTYIFYGKVNKKNGRLVMEQAAMFTEEQYASMEQVFLPVYTLTNGLSNNLVTKTVRAALGDEHLFMDYLPHAIREKYGLCEYNYAIRQIHFPEDMETLITARRRLVFDEFFLFILSMQYQKEKHVKEKNEFVFAEDDFTDELIEQLPYELTNAQKKALADVKRDMRSETVMQRLIQGDVGSGKTLVAALAALRAIAHGKQVALMAPTELLAEQHANNFRNWFEPLGIEVGWLAGKQKGKARLAQQEAIASGQVQMIVGTHAIFQEQVQFNGLALVIIDEQHRFGVHQRLALWEKGQQQGFHPHQLIMTATPIPRTLAMTAYADLDTSVIDELRPGRTPVTTVAIPDTRRTDIIDRVRHACITEGRQAYWVCTLIEESELLEAQAAEATWEELKLALPELNVGLVHGRMKPAEKQAVMASFKQGELHLLVATTVIEVGVDVPNASLMIIENPERLGLAQLHQLRGRVGRGAVASHCVLLYKTPLSKTAQIRLQVLRDSNDGFVIAQKDLEIRGPGELLGTRQTGNAEFKVADLLRDQAMIPEVQRLARHIHERYPQQAKALIERWMPETERYSNA